MSKKPSLARKVLLIEDDDEDYFIIRQLFSDNLLKNYRLDRVSTFAEAMHGTKCFEHDVYILDYFLGAGDGLQLLKSLISRNCPAPVVLITGHDNHELDLRAMRLGAVDYLAKNVLTASMLERSMRYAIERKKIEVVISQAKREWEYTFDAIPDPIAVIDRNHRLARVNKAMAEKLGTTPQKLIGSPCYVSVHGMKAPHSLCPHLMAIKTGMSCSSEIYIENFGGDFVISASPYFDDASRLLGSIHVARDVTQQKKAQDVIRKVNEELERRVAERTAELQKKTLDLAEVNTALKVLLRERDEDRKFQEESFLKNINSLVQPYIERLRKTQMSKEQVEYLNIIESEIDRVASPLVKTLSDKYLGLTPMEIQVVGLIRQGKSNKEIAEILHLSENTIKSHRFNLRSKLGLRGKKKGLRSFNNLLSL